MREYASLFPKMPPPPKPMFLQSAYRLLQTFHQLFHGTRQIWCIGISRAMCTVHLSWNIWLWNIIHWPYCNPFSRKGEARGRVKQKKKDKQTEKKDTKIKTSDDSNLDQDKARIWWKERIIIFSNQSLREGDRHSWLLTNWMFSLSLFYFFIKPSNGTNMERH